MNNRLTLRSQNTRNNLNYQLPMFSQRSQAAL